MIPGSKAKTKLKHQLELVERQVKDSWHPAQDVIQLAQHVGRLSSGLSRINDALSRSGGFAVNESNIAADMPSAL